MKIVGFSLEQGNKYFGKIDGTGFFIGGADQAITLAAADFGVVVVETKGLPAVTK